MSYGFKAMLEAIEKTGQQRAFTHPPSEDKPPQICPLPDGECHIKACPQRLNQDQHGKPCWYYTEENKGTPLSDPLARIPFEKRLEQTLRKAMKPIYDRIDRLENQTDYHVTRSLTPTFNGQRKRVDIGMNQERMHNG